MDAADAGRALLEAEDRWARLGTQCLERADHVAVRFAAGPLAHAGNQFREIRLPAGADPEEFLGARLEEAGTWGWAVCRLEIDDRTFPASLGDWLGAQEFLPTVHTGLLARAPDVAAPPRLTAVARATPDQVPLVEGLLASQALEARRGADAAAATLELQRARLWRGECVVWLAQLGDRPAGMAAVAVTGSLHYVRMIYVAEACRSQGIGTALVRAVAEAAGNDAAVGLFAPTASDLPDAYRTRGFAAVTRRETWLRIADAVE